MDSQQPTQHFFESQRLRLSYWAWGNEDAQPLILLHGGRDHARSWDGLAEAFAADHYVVAPDLRGHGESAWSPGSEYTTSQYAVDLLTLVERFERPVRVVCHSFGGQITFIAAGTYPGRFASIVAIEGRVAGLFEEPQPMDPERFRAYVEQRRSLETRQVRRYPDLESAIRRVQEMNPRLSPEQARHIAVHAVREDGTSSSGSSTTGRGRVCVGTSSRWRRCAASWTRSPAPCSSCWGARLGRSGAWGAGRRGSRTCGRWWSKGRATGSTTTSPSG